MGNTPIERFVLDTTSRDTTAYCLGVKLMGRASLLDKKFRPETYGFTEAGYNGLCFRIMTCKLSLFAHFRLTSSWASKIDCSPTPRYERPFHDARHRFCRPRNQQKVLVGGVKSVSAPIIDSLATYNTLLVSLSRWLGARTSRHTPIIPPSCPQPLLRA